MLNDVLYINAQGGLQTPHLVICYTETHHFHMLQHTQKLSNFAHFSLLGNIFQICVIIGSLFRHEASQWGY